MRKYLIAGFVVATCTATAQETPALDALIQKSAECEALTDPSEIETCNNEGRELLATAQAENARIQAAAYAWNIVDDGSESGEIMLIKRAQDNNQCPGAGANLVFLRCIDSHTYVSFQFNGCTFPSQHVQGSIVTYGAGEEFFTFVAEDGAFGLHGDEVTVPLISNMIDGPSILVTALPARGPQQTIKFRMAGLEEFLPVLSDACHW